MELKPYVRKVNYYETDQMGVVHHSNYIRWFEEARTESLNQVGLSYANMEEMGIIIPVLDVTAQYKTTVKFGETVVIEVKLEKFNGIKAQFSYIITEEKSGRLCTTGTTSHCFVDRDMKPMHLKKTFPEIYKAMLRIVEETDK